MDLIQDLQRQGWYLSENGIKECSKLDSVSVQEIIQEALNTDLKQIGEKHLPESLGKSKSEFVDGPFVLQVQKIRNVAIPKDAEHSDGGQKLYRLTLTDGHGTCTAVDMKGISGLSHNTPPGSKVKLLGRVPISHGFLLLNNSNCKVLGGRVEKLVESWELKKSLATQNRVAVNQDGGPPPFIPFGQRRKDAGQTSNKRDTFRSLDSVMKKKNADSEFEQQRKAIIEAALQEGRSKGFASISSKQVQAQDRSVASIVEMGFSADQANTALRKSGGNLEAAVNVLVGEQSCSSSNAHSARRSTDSRHSSSQPNRPQLLVNSERTERSGGGRRGQRSEEMEDYDEHARPSAPATLFDFVTTIIPKKPDKSSSKPSDSISAESTTGKRREERPEESREVGNKQRQRSPEGPGGDHGTHDESREKPVINCSSTNQSSGGGGGGAEPNYHNVVQNLPPRLQKKQMREEEEKMYKAVGKDMAMNDWSRDRLNSKVYDVNSRGTIANKNLWTDDKDDRGKDRRDRRGGGGGRGKTEDGRPTEREKSSNEKIYQRNANNIAAYQGPYADTSAVVQQPLQVVQEVGPLVNCTPCTVPPLMQCTTDVQLVQSMSGLHLFPAAAISLGPTFVPRLAAVSPSVICDGAADNASKENTRWKAGDLCLAKWEDKEFYRAKVLRADSNGALVTFIDYGNDVSRLPYSDLRPMRSDGGGGGGGAWFTSGGILYPGSAVEHGTNIIYPSHNGHLSAATVAGAPTPGVIVQGPGSYPLDHTYRIITNTGRSLNGQKQSKRPIDKQLYVPPAQRK